MAAARATTIKFGDYLNVTDEGDGVIRVDGCPPGGTITTLGGGGLYAIAEGLGLIAWTADPAACTNTYRPSTKTVLAPVWLASGTVITSISVSLSAIEATPPTHAKFAIYTAAFALGAQTADLPATLAVGWNTWNLTSPYTAPADGLYYIGGFYDAASQTPTMIGSQFNTAVLPAMPGSGLYRSPMCNALTAWSDPFVPTASSTITPCYVLL